jgi:UDP-N-acetylmuramoyl-L-alanyl-D-glutamate--2,6-diaminopimelate ligase
VRLDRLLGQVEVRDLRGDPAATDVTAVVHDSAAVRPGALFCCLVGRRADGHAYAPGAVQSGAVALLVDRALDVPPSVTQVLVPDTRAAMAPVAAAFHGHPSRRLAVVGVTGTNGKTTTTHLLQAVLEADGRPTAVIGTLSGTRTTPESPELQARLAELAAGGARAVAMEVSSHALAQHRADATWFEVAVFTNLSQDHLDFHGTLDDYFAAKASLFRAGRAGAAVVNADDPWGRRLLEITPLPTTTFSMADATEVEVGVDGTTFGWRGEPVRLRLPGVANVANALAAAAAARVLGVGATAVAKGLSAVSSVPGRYEAVDAGQPFTVLVDYAHTPAALEQALTGARAMSPSRRVVLVFGCGGERDAGKRPLMGDVATRLADRVVLTTDNPRGEDPAAIVEAVRGGAARPEVLVVEPDRRAAIALALADAGPDDVVVIAGKGHESTQVVGDRALPFDDREVARDLLRALGW